MGPIKRLTWSSSTGSPEMVTGLGAVKNREPGKCLEQERKVTHLPFLKITLGESPKMAAPGRETWPAYKQRQWGLELSRKGTKEGEVRSEGHLETTPVVFTPSSTGRSSQKHEISPDSSSSFASNPSLKSASTPCQVYLQKNLYMTLIPG